ncbi:MAG: hypothetical protein J4O03_01285 [Chloroflexi bacterium]|nr:hypothetical protein [Chloroflexota bacterium]MCI0779838.1 hypothetical protein [Chloroflexota bacterium]MCI0785662.1 hypothetical protein [Chloroflexota bacterium]MCI0792072.1 hypothetical protein [Chloroflexota bacterium]MCI0797903.1 hypothetical protein [Chloroflexota bacterium]
MARLWAKTVTFESVAVGDQLPILAKWETEETIARFNALISREDAEPEDGEASQGASSGQAAGAPALAAYVLELLEKAFPIPGILAMGSKLDIQTLQPVRPDDTITLTGEVVDKRLEEDRRLVECVVLIENQHGQTVARAVTVVCL